jgi:hypothetical protein
VILAVLSVVGGFVGYGNHFEHFLAPVFEQGAEAAAQGAAPEAVKSLEYLLMGVSISVAALGWFLAWLLYSRTPQLPARIAARLGGIYEAVSHKYYVDEIYAALFHRRDRQQFGHGRARSIGQRPAYAIGQFALVCGMGGRGRGGGDRLYGVDGSHALIWKVLIPSFFRWSRLSPQRADC